MPTLAEAAADHSAVGVYRKQEAMGWYREFMVLDPEFLKAADQVDAILLDCRTRRIGVEEAMAALTSIGCHATRAGGAA